MIAKKGEYARRAVGMKRVEQETGVDRRTEIGTPENGIVSYRACSDAPGRYLLILVLEPAFNHSGHESLAKEVRKVNK